MKKLVLLLAVLTAVAGWAQQAGAPPVQATNLVERPMAPTYSDLYCAGFIASQEIGRTNFVAGGKESPETTGFGTGEIIYLNGTGYQENQLYSAVRELRDPNQFEAFPGQHGLVKRTGQAYADLGHVRILQASSGHAIARIEFGCQVISPGDLIIPFQEKPRVAFRQTKAPFDEFPTAPSRLQARIIMSRDFDMFLGAGQKVYINAGSDQGVKPGDYFRVMRGYSPSVMDPAAAISYDAPTVEDTQRQPPKPAKGGRDLPRRALGEVVVLSTSRTASTAMITLSLSSIKVGDEVELEAPPQ